MINVIDNADIARNPAVDLDLLAEARRLRGELPLQDKPSYTLQRPFETRLGRVLVGVPPIRSLKFDAE